jgi:hypothetical protein
MSVSGMTLSPNQLGCFSLAFQLIELHSIPAAWAGLQDIELAGISQREDEQMFSGLTRRRLQEP